MWRGTEGGFEGVGRGRRSPRCYGIAKLVLLALRRAARPGQDIRTAGK